MLRLNKRQVIAAWRLLKRSDLNIFVAGVFESLRSVRGWRASGLPISSETGFVSLLDALRSIAEIEGERPPDVKVDLVVSGLPRAAGFIDVLRTSDVVLSMIEAARREVIILGYDLRHAELIRLLHKRAMEGLQVTIVGDRIQAGMRDMKANWPAGAVPLRALVNSEAPDERSRQELMHAKVIVCDRSIALIGSANFTSGGLERNIEVGVRVVGPVASRISDLIEGLARTRWLEAV